MPSPKSQAYDAIEPSESAEPEASNDAARAVAVELKAAVGFTFGATTVRSWLTTVLVPRLSVTVSVAV